MADKLDEFLNPKSMTTPGIMGGIVMMLTNTCYHMFHIEPRWSALILSFICGAIVFNAKLGRVRALVFYVLNSLVILSMANGTNAIGYAVAKPDEKPEISTSYSLPSPLCLLITPVYAEPTPTNTVASTNKTTSTVDTNKLDAAATKAKLEALERQLKALQTTNMILQQQQIKRSQPMQQKQFFQRSWY